MFCLLYRAANPFIYIFPNFILMFCFLVLLDCLLILSESLPGENMDAYTLIVQASGFFNL